MELFAKKEAAPQPQDSGNPGGMFGGAPPHAPQQGPDLGVIMRKMHITDERTVNLRRKVQVIEHNMLEHHKRLLGEIKFISKELSDLKREFDELKGGLRILSKEFERAAKKEDIQVLERYINMWEPVHFVTRRDVERMIEEKLEEQNFK